MREKRLMAMILCQQIWAHKKVRMIPKLRILGGGRRRRRRRRGRKGKSRRRRRRMRRASVGIITLCGDPHLKTC